MADMGQPQTSSGGGLKTRIMGMPAYMWVAIAAVGGAAVLLWRRGSGSADGAADNQPAGFTPPSSDETEFMGDEERYQTLLAQIRDLQGSVATKIPTPASTSTGTTKPDVQPAKGGMPTTPAPGSHRGYGWHHVVKGESAAQISKNYGITLPTFYAYNGPSRIVAGEYVKVRFRSNPVAGPYYGK